MIRHRKFFRFLLWRVIWGAVFLAAAISYAHAQPLSDLKWLPADADVATLLTSAPPECLFPPSNPDKIYPIEVGRVAFRAPALLGGPAAREGLSCQNCHINGHANPHFFLEGLSDAPGTVDPTSSIFSKVRGDGVFNPVPIPTLVGANSKKTFGHEQKEPSLENFTRGVIEDEFQGAPPHPVIFNGLVAYIRELNPALCRFSDPEPITLTGDIADLDRAAQTLVMALEKEDAAVADFLLVAIRGILGRMHERFSPQGLQDQRSRLAELSQALGAIRSLISRDPAAAKTQALAWREKIPAVAAWLSIGEDRSFYRRTILETHLRQTEKENQ